MVTAVRYRGKSRTEASLKKAVTRRSAWSLLRSSLMTSVSTRYTLRLGRILDARKVLVTPDLGHSGQYLGQVTLPRATQDAGQDLPMLGLCTAPMFCRALLERQDQRCIDLSDDQIGHDSSIPK